MAEHQIETVIEINASCERVWRILTDFEAMPSWNRSSARFKGRFGLEAASPFISPLPAGLRCGFDRTC
jgi:uncharacterized protein YndB with AHSA1/START domain